MLPHPPRDTRTFPTEKDKAIFTVSPTEVLHVPEGRLLLQTMRSHDQFNTTIYGLDDRYRGIKNGRRVVFVHPDDIAALGLRGGPVRRHRQRVGGRHRAARPALPGRRLRHPARLHGAYYPETNALVPLDSKAVGSNQPAFKSVVVRLEARAASTEDDRIETARADVSGSLQPGGASDRKVTGAAPAPGLTPDRLGP